MELRWVGSGDVDEVMAAGALFDDPPQREATKRFLAEPTHHLALATIDGQPAGFVTGVETTHPDKGTEMFLYELGVDDAFRRRGVGRALVDALGARARARGCVGMWVVTEPDNEAAIATYRSAGAGEPEPSVALDWTFTEG